MCYKGILYNVISTSLERIKRMLLLVYSIRKNIFNLTIFIYNLIKNYTKGRVIGGGMLGALDE